MEHHEYVHAGSKVVHVSHVSTSQFPLGLRDRTVNSNLRVEFTRWLSYVLLIGLRIPMVARRSLVLRHGGVTNKLPLPLPLPPPPNVLRPTGSVEVTAQTAAQRGRMRPAAGLRFAAAAAAALLLLLLAAAPPPAIAQGQGHGGPRPGPYGPLAVVPVGGRDPRIMTSVAQPPAAIQADIPAFRANATLEASTAAVSEGRGERGVRQAGGVGGGGWRGASACPRSAPWVDGGTVGT